MFMNVNLFANFYALERAIILLSLKFVVVCFVLVVAMLLLQCCCCNVLNKLTEYWTCLKRLTVDSI